LHRVKLMAIDYMSGVALIAMQQQDHTWTLAAFY